MLLLSTLALVTSPGHADTTTTVPALLRATQHQVDRGWGAGDPAERLEHFRNAEELAREALALSPAKPEARWWLVVALGLTAQESPLLRRIGLVRELRAQTESLLEEAPNHPGGHHAMGRLHAAVSRLDPVSRGLITLLAGGDELDAASWDTAESHLRRALELEPGAPHHSVELARILRDRGQPDEAYREAERALAATADTPLAHWYRGWAAELLEELGPEGRATRPR
ncbi:MAG: tetratricopeptide repeat protein [Gemmatimonadota bacterium]